MLKLIIPETSVFIEDKNEFYPIPETTLSLEHSLLSVKKWESHWKVPFLRNNEKTAVQMIDYIRCMTLTKNVDPMVYHAISEEDMGKIADYIKDPMCATTFGDDRLIGAQRHSSEMVTAETIYYWMIALNIPVEFQKWHLEQLLALIKLTNIKNDPKKRKMTQRDLIQRNAEINEANKKFFGVKGQ